MINFYQRDGMDRMVVCWFHSFKILNSLLYQRYIFAIFSFLNIKHDAINEN